MARDEPIIALFADEAQALGLKDYTTADLKRPLINIQLGTGFLALQAKAASGDRSRCGP